MQTTVGSLILVVSAVVLTCIVVDYAVNVVEATLQIENNPQLQRLRDLHDSILNQTDTLVSETLTETIVPESTPTPTPLLMP
jgi:hypothetical protein